MTERELAGFPTSEAARRMLGRVSPVYEGPVAKWLFQVMGLEWDEARAIFEQLPLQGFPEQATWGLEYWEQLFQIQPDPEAGQEERRRAVLLRRDTRAPMNPEHLRQLVEQAAGVEARVLENVAPYVFEVILAALPGVGDEAALRDLLDRVKPSHQDYRISFEQSTSLELYGGGAFAWGREFDMRQVN